MTGESEMVEDEVLIGEVLGKSVYIRQEVYDEICKKYPTKEERDKFFRDFLYDVLPLVRSKIIGDITLTRKELK